MQRSGAGGGGGWAGLKRVALSALASRELGGGKLRLVKRRGYESGLQIKQNFIFRSAANSKGPRQNGYRKAAEHCSRGMSKIIPREIITLIFSYEH